MQIIKEEIREISKDWRLVPKQNYLLILILWDILEDK